MNSHFELLGMARGVLEFSPIGPPMATATADGYRRYALRWLENPEALRATLTAGPRSTQRFAEAAVRHELLNRLEVGAYRLRDALDCEDEERAEKVADDVRQCLVLLKEVRPSRRGRRALALHTNSAE